MRLKTLALFAFLLVRFPLAAQVQLGGHPYVPSTTDSTGGLTILEIAGAVGTCNIVALTTGCTLENSNSGAPGQDAPWVQTIRINGSISGNLLVLVPYTPGRSYTIINPFTSLTAVSVQGWNVSSSSVTGDVTSVPSRGQITVVAGINSSNVNSYEPTGVSGLTNPIVVPVEFQGGYTCSTSQTLSTSVSPTDTTFPLTDSSCFPTSGYAAMAVNNTSEVGGGGRTIEYISWTGNSSNNLTGVTRGLFASTAVAWTAGAQYQLLDGIVSIVATSTSSSPAQVTFVDGATLYPQTPGVGTNNPNSTYRGPYYGDAFWSCGSPDFCHWAIDVIGDWQNIGAPNPASDLSATMRSDSAAANNIIGNVVRNTSNGSNAQAGSIWANDDASDGGMDAYLSTGIHSSGWTPGSDGENGSMGTPQMGYVYGSGIPITIGTMAGPNGIDPIIHFAYNNHATDDASIDSAGFHIQDASDGVGTNCATVSATGLIGHAAGPCGGSLSSATNCTSTASPAVCGSAQAGSIALPAPGTSTLTVNTTAVTANSQIYLQFDQSLGTKLGVTCAVASVNAPVGVVTARVSGTSFTFGFFGPTLTNPGCFSYIIVN